MFGPHIHKGTSKTYEQALQKDIDEMKTYGVQMKSGQVFVMGPKNVNPNFTIESAEQFGQYAKKEKIEIIVHNTYMASLWNSDLSKRPFAKMTIQKQLLLCDAMNSAGFVIHIPNETISDIMMALESLELHKFKTPVYLETKAANPAGKDAMNYEKTENLDKLFGAIAGRPFGQYVGHCVDTAHLWSSGVSMTGRAEVVKYFSDLSRVAAGHLWKKLAGGQNGLIFHLNDAVNEFANGKDEHQLLGKGRIWGADKTGLTTLIDFIKEADLIAILERNKEESLENDCLLIK